MRRPEPSAVAEISAPVFSRPETSLVQSLADRTTFVGREAERSALRRLLERALRGEGGVAMIGGALGVGKTRIAAEFAAEASDRGFIDAGRQLLRSREFSPLQPVRRNSGVGDGSIDEPGRFPNRTRE